MHSIRSVLIGGVVLMTVSVAGANFVAYNDVCYSSTHGALAPNVTTINIGSGSPGPASGVLKDFGTGNPTGVTASFTQSGGVIWQPDLVTGGDDADLGTDARNVFNPGTASLKGTVYYGSDGWWVDLALTGLDPTKEYEFATSANRKGGSSYLTRLTRFSISGADAYTNASTAGTTIGDGGASTTFSTGENTATGYVARWTGISPGADGSITFRAQQGSTAERRGYAFEAFMLVEIPEPATAGLLSLAGLALLRQKR